MGTVAPVLSESSSTGAGALETITVDAMFKKGQGAGFWMSNLTTSPFRLVAVGWAGFVALYRTVRPKEVKACTLAMQAFDQLSFLCGYPREYILPCQPSPKST